jgi:transposase
MGHVEGKSRYQRLLLAPSLDEIVDEAHPVRVIDAFVDTLDLRGMGFSKVVAEETGRPPYHPGDLLKLYIYGYTNQMRSSRRLEREAMRNIEVRWLIDQLTPAFKTIADFRKDHRESIVEVCRAFIRFCRGQRLVGGQLVAIDGTKIEAVASRRRVITPASLAKQIEAIDAQIAEYLTAMDVVDSEETAEAAPAHVAAALDLLRNRRDMAQARARSMADEGLTQVVDLEPEARLMKTARQGHQVAYNAQTAVDGEHGLIVAFDLTSEGNDQRQLLPMAEQAKEALGVETLTVVADTGYSNGEQGQACENIGVTAAVPRHKTVNASNPNLFSREVFIYDKASDSWTCPAGETLARLYVSQSEQKTYYGTKACAGCGLKAQCTTAAKGRMVVRHLHEDAREAMHQRTVEDPTWMKRRRELVEHPYGHIKWLMGYPKFLLRGRKKAKSELALLVMGFNLKRSINILGVPALLEAFRAAPA